jgi:HupE / UreJ protein
VNFVDSQKFVPGEFDKVSDKVLDKGSRAGVRVAFLTLLLLFTSLLPASAHLPTLATGTASFDPDGHFTLDLTFDVLAFALDQKPQDATDDSMRQLLNGPTNTLAASMADAELRFEHEFLVLADNRPGSVTALTFPTAEDVQRYKESVGVMQFPMMLVLSLEGRIATNAHSVSFRFPTKLDTVALTVMRPFQPPGALLVNPGETTAPMPLQLADTTPAPANVPAAAEPSRWQLAGRYLVLGFEHILPKGLDHILFVLGLFLLGNRLRPLLWQVTAFTVAHSITLGLSLYGVLRLPSAVVEPLIAASIAFVAVENLCTSELKPWRPFVVFGFGLMHGLGFAGVLTSLGLPRNAFATALITFNLGVELGQLTVITLAFAAVGWWRRRPWYRQAIVLPASGAIAVTGLFWTVQRILLALR